MRGTVHRTGSSPMTQLVLRPADGRRAIVLTGPDTVSLARVGGLDVEARGRLQPSGELLVTGFVVRSADGQPALDGTLERAGPDLMLRTASRTVRLGNPPAALRTMVGARVWLTGPTETGPNVYGVITPAK